MDEPSDVGFDHVESNMIEDATVVTIEGLEALVSALSQVGSGDGSDHECDQVRIDQLAVLERVKSAVAAAQVRVTAAFVDSQEQVAQAWLERAAECSEAHTVQTTTPTGHTYASHAPPLLPARQPEPAALSPLEHALTLALAA